MRGVFISGTDTDVGKTFVSALIARQLAEAGVRVGVYKPACSGARVADGRLIWDDIETLAQAARVDDRDRVCPQKFEAPLAPPVAARQAGGCVDWRRVQFGLTNWNEHADFVLVEGVGGLLCPLTESHSVADFAIWSRLPVVIVARLGLGTINHTLLTLEAAESRGLEVEGVILNDVDNSAGSLAGKSNEVELERLCGVPILGVVPFGGRLLQLREHVDRERISWLREVDHAMD